MAVVNIREVYPGVSLGLWRVSYKHLTLPTKREGVSFGGGALLKKKKKE